MYIIFHLEYLVIYKKAQQINLAVCVIFLTCILFIFCYVYYTVNYINNQKKILENCAETLLSALTIDASNELESISESDFIELTIYTKNHTNIDLSDGHLDEIYKTDWQKTILYQNLKNNETICFDWPYIENDVYILKIGFETENKKAYISFSNKSNIIDGIIYMNAK